MPPATTSLVGLPERCIHSPILHTTQFAELLPAQMLYQRPELNTTFKLQGVSNACPGAHLCLKAHCQASRLVSTDMSHLFCLSAGAWPVSYANLYSVGQVGPTGLVLANNNLTGGIPMEWGARNLSMWSEMMFANNSRLCGQVPSWFYTRFGADGPAAPITMLNGA